MHQVVLVGTTHKRVPCISLSMPPSSEASLVYRYLMEALLRAGVFLPVGKGTQTSAWYLLPLQALEKCFHGYPWSRWISGCTDWLSQELCAIQRRKELCTGPFVASEGAGTVWI